MKILFLLYSFLFVGIYCFGFSIKMAVFPGVPEFFDDDNDNDDDDDNDNNSNSNNKNNNNNKTSTTIWLLFSLQACSRLRAERYSPANVYVISRVRRSNFPHVFCEPLRKPDPSVFFIFVFCPIFRLSLFFRKVGPS